MERKQSLLLFPFDVWGGKHLEESRDPIDILGALGGREIAAMAAAMLRARHLRIPLIIDGFICSSAASLFHAANIGASRVYLGAHYPLDVLAGATLGCALGWGIRFLLL